MTHVISKKAMLARLSISIWSARKLDKTATAKVKEEYQTSSDAGRYNKALIATNALKKVQSAAGDARTFHYQQTLPWNDDGARILPAANFFAYSEGMRKHKAAFQAAVSEFLTEYPALVEDAKIRLNSLFVQSDYPSTENIVSKYSFETQVDPLPDANDFRVDLGDAEVSRIKAELDARSQQAQAAAMKDVWSRLHTAVSAMAERLSTPDAIFRDSLVGNIVELVDLLPRLNIAGDTELDRLTREVYARLTAYEPETLRTDKKTRQTVANDCAEIMSKMCGYMNAA